MRLGTVALGVAVAILHGVFKRTVNAVWDDLWQQVFNAIAEAEARWQNGQGQKKKAEVMQLATTWLRENVGVSGLKLWLARLILSHAIDAIVAEINDELGKGWVEIAREYERQLADWLPVVE